MVDRSASCQASGCDKRAAISVRTVTLCDTHMELLARRLVSVKRAPSRMEGEALLRLVEEAA